MSCLQGCVVEFPSVRVRITSTPKQWFSNFSVHLITGGLVKGYMARPHPRRFWFSKFGWHLIMCTFNHFSGNELYWPGATLWELKALAWLSARGKKWRGAWAWRSTLFIKSNSWENAFYLLTEARLNDSDTQLLQNIVQQFNEEMTLNVLLWITSNMFL